MPVGVTGNTVDSESAIQGSNPWRASNYCPLRLVVGPEPLKLLTLVRIQQGHPDFC